MNTKCEDCYFSNSNYGCSFNIPDLIKDSYEIKKQDGYNYIREYKCSYAFSKQSFDKYKDQLPEDIEEFVRQQNKLNYYLIVDASDELDDEILSISNSINTLNNIPHKISVITFIDKEQLKSTVKHYQSEMISDWKIHNLIIKNQSENERLFDILNVNTLRVDFIIYIHFQSISQLQEDLNYINFLYNVKKPNYAAIRKNDSNLDGLCLSTNNLSLLKREHSSKYIDFLSNNNTIVKKYYE